MQPSTILLAEDHALVRQGLKALLQHVPELKVVGETGDGASVAALIEALRPDLLLLDLGLPGCSGFELIETLKRRRDPVRIVVLTGNLRYTSVTRALTAGADGYVPKSDNTEDLLEAIATVLDGRKYISRQVEDALTRRVAPAQAAELALTPRQREIMCLVARGCGNEHIAAVLGISIFTVRTHRQHFMRKLNLRNAAEITSYAIQCGFYMPT